MEPKPRTSCKGCGSTTRPLSAPGPRCATCHRARKKVVSKQAHERRAASVYSLSRGAYDLIAAEQGGTCALCTRNKGISKRLAIDHDHACCSGKTSCGQCVRGLLCSPCNDVLAVARDQIEYFERCIAYLKSPPARKVLDAMSGVQQGSEDDSGGPVVQTSEDGPEVRRVGDAVIPGVDEYAARLDAIVDAWKRTERPDDA